LTRSADFECDKFVELSCWKENFMLGYQNALIETGSVGGFCGVDKLPLINTALTAHKN
jgi:hypothetical protein